MNVHLFYKFTRKKPKKYQWYSIEEPNNEFIPTFTKRIFKKVAKVY